MNGYRKYCGMFTLLSLCAHRLFMVSLCPNQEKWI
jgi:hypothetical protein